MTCHCCGTPMYQHDATGERWWCRCGVWRDPAESAEQVAAREAGTADVMAMLDAAIAAGRRGTEEQRATDRQTIVEMEAIMGQTIQTRGCSKCGGTMYRVVETDSHGNPISSSVYVCNGCGNMEG